MRKLTFALFSILLIFFGLSAYGQMSEDNSNFWTVHRDTQTMFRISYPRDWVVAHPKGPNVRFSVYPPDGAGNCNVVVRHAPELKNFTQKELSDQLSLFPQDSAGLADLLGLPASGVHVIDSRMGKVWDIPAWISTVETKLVNLEGEFSRYQIVVVILKPGEIWNINCGVTLSGATEAKIRFTVLKPKFVKMLGSFVFL